MTNTALDTVLQDIGGMIEEVSGNIPEGVYIKIYNSLMEVRSVAQSQTTELTKVANRAFRDNRELRTRLGQSNYVAADLMRSLSAERVISADLSKSLASERMAATWIVDPNTLRVMSTAERLSQCEASSSRISNLEISNKRMRDTIERMELDSGRTLNPTTGRMIARNGQTARKLRRLSN